MGVFIIRDAAAKFPPIFSPEIQCVMNLESDPIDISRAISSICNENKIARLHYIADICREGFRQMKVRQ